MKRSVIRIVIGYLGAVSAAALCQAVWWTVHETAQDNLGLHPIQAMMQMFRIGWVYAFILALLPFSVGVYVERERGIFRPSFFVAGAAVTGILAIVPVACFHGGVFDQSDASFLERFLDLLPRFGVSAVLAGFVYFGIRNGLVGRVPLDAESKVVS